MRPHIQGKKSADWPEIKAELLRFLPQGTVRDAIEKRDDIRVAAKALRELSEATLSQVTPQAIILALAGKEGDELYTASQRLVELAKSAKRFEDLHQSLQMSETWGMVPSA